MKKATKKPAATPEYPQTDILLGHGELAHLAFKDLFEDLNSGVLENPAAILSIQRLAFQTTLVHTFTPWIRGSHELRISADGFAA